MVRIALCDDESVFLDKIQRLIQEYAKSKNHVIDLVSFQSPQTLWDEIKDGTIFDVYLLDIEMPGLDGLKLAKGIRELSPDAPILFLSSHVELSREGYKVDAMRFVSKLTLEDELCEALDAALRGAQKAQESYLTVTHYHDVVRVAYHEIIYVIRVMRYLEIHTVRQGILTTGRGIKDTFAQLQDNRFVFIGRSCFVNLDHVLQLSESEIELDTGERLPISRKMLPGVKATILQVWGAKP